VFENGRRRNLEFVGVELGVTIENPPLRWPATTAALVAWGLEIAGAKRDAGGDGPTTRRRPWRSVCASLGETFKNGQCENQVIR